MGPSWKNSQPSTLPKGVPGALGPNGTQGPTLITKPIRLQDLHTPVETKDTTAPNRAQPPRAPLVQLAAAEPLGGAADILERVDVEDETVGLAARGGRAP